MSKILPGQTVKDKVSGISGVVDHVVTYRYGCPRVAFMPTLPKNATALPEMIMLDEPQLEIVNKKRVISTEASPKKYEMGQKVKDSFTGFKGVQMGRSIYMNGCARVWIQPNTLVKNGVQDGIWVEEERVVAEGRVLKAKATETVETRGGPAPSRPTRPSGPIR